MNPIRFILHLKTFPLFNECSSLPCKLYTMLHALCPVVLSRYAILWLRAKAEPGFQIAPLTRTKAPRLPLDRKTLP